MSTRNHAELIDMVREIPLYAPRTLYVLGSQANRAPATVDAARALPSKPSQDGDASPADSRIGSWSGRDNGVHQLMRQSDPRATFSSRHPADADRSRQRAVSGIFRVPDGSARRVLVEAMLDLIRQIHIAEVRHAVPIHGNYRWAEGWEPASARSLPELYQRLASRAEAVATEFPRLGGPVWAAAVQLATVLDPAAELPWLWSAFEHSVNRLAGFLDSADEPDFCMVEATQSELRIRIASGPNGKIADDVPAGELEPATFLAAVGSVHRQARASQRLPSAWQRVAEHAAYDQLDRGVRIFGPYRTWGTSGFRDHQTYLSVADPGEGHLDGTLRNADYLDGVIVHIEHLERGSEQSRDAVDPYRISCPRTITRVRLALSQDAPMSSSAGRPVFENDVETGMLKAVHTTAAVCSELFAEGLTECKVPIQTMTATQAVRFMRALAAAVRRDPSTQVLSAAFNLNTPIFDDRPGCRRVSLAGPATSSRLRAGLLGIELTREGGFDKVSWDETEFSYPSRCILEQLAPEEALVLVHAAHELGLLTHFSAGFRFEHLPLAVYTGVDGVEVGDAQILRYVDPQTGHHGPLVPENIARILQIRDKAEAEPRGQAAALLSRLDRMRFELSIDRCDDERRRRLFALLRSPAPDARQLDELLAELRHISRLQVDVKHPLLSWVQRLEQADTGSVAAALVNDWRSTLHRLSRAADRHDFDHLSEQLDQIRVRAEPTSWTETV